MNQPMVMPMLAKFNKALAEAAGSPEWAAALAKRAWVEAVVRLVWPAPLRPEARPVEGDRMVTPPTSAVGTACVIKARFVYVGLEETDANGIVVRRTLNVLKARGVTETPAPASPWVLAG